MALNFVMKVVVMLRIWAYDEKVFLYEFFINIKIGLIACRYKIVACNGAPVFWELLD